MLERIESSQEKVFRVPQEKRNFQELADIADEEFDDIIDEAEELDNKLDTEEPATIKQSINIPNRIPPAEPPKLNKIQTDDPIEIISNLNLTFRKGAAILKIIEGDITGAINLLERELK